MKIKEVLGNDKNDICGTIGDVWGAREATFFGELHSLTRDNHGKMGESDTAERIIPLQAQADVSTVT